MGGVRSIRRVQVQGPLRLQRDDLLQQAVELPHRLRQRYWKLPIHAGIPDVELVVVLDNGLLLEGGGNAQESRISICCRWRADADRSGDQYPVPSGVRYVPAARSGHGL